MVRLIQEHGRTRRGTSPDDPVEIPRQVLAARPAYRIVTSPEGFSVGLGLRVERRYYRRLLDDWGVRIDRASVEVEAETARLREAEKRGGIRELTIELKYHEGEPVIREITRVSSPGRRVYSQIKALRAVHGGLGIAILSTPKGVLSDADARAANVGGEVLAEVF
mgnify:CR=1 FL=1